MMGQAAFGGVEVIQQKGFLSDLQMYHYRETDAVSPEASAGRKSRADRLVKVEIEFSLRLVSRSQSMLYFYKSSFLDE